MSIHLCQFFSWNLCGLEEGISSRLMLPLQINKKTSYWASPIWCAISLRMHEQTQIQLIIGKNYHQKVVKFQELSNNMQIKAILINFEFKILENILCTLLYDFRWKTISKEWKVNEPLMSLLLRFWDREPSSLCSHVLKSFYKKLFYPHFICENYINSIFIMSILNLVISCIWQQKCTWYLEVI